MFNLSFLILGVLQNFTPFTHPDHNQQIIRDRAGTGDYTSSTFTDHIDQDSTNIILEIGSRDAIDALKLSHFYNTHVFAFECNPYAIEICKYNIRGNPNITLVPLACWNESKDVSFHPVIGTKFGNTSYVNIGASSILELHPENSANPDIRDEITVPAVRLNEWLALNNLDHIDLLCLDVEGATLQVLQGLGDSIKNVTYIITEIFHGDFYENQATAESIDTFLTEAGFAKVSQIGDEEIQSDILYVNHFLDCKK